MNDHKQQTANGQFRVLMQNRGKVYEQRGGDTVLMDRTAEGLRKLGVEVVIDITGEKNPADFDIVHLFNFAMPQLTEILAKNAHACGTPYVISTLCEDIEKFSNQGWEVSACLVDYVNGGQDKDWWEKNKVDINKVAPREMFDNHWAAKHAAALLTNGAEESRVVRRCYGEDLTIREVPLGYDIGIQADPNLFINEFGIKDFIFCVGRLEIRKNQLMLLKALEDCEIPVVFAAGGFSYQPDYDEAARKFKRKGQTVFLERLSDEMLASAYAAAKVHALPSWYELPGLVSLEAAYYGSNVVVTEYGTSRDYLGDKAFYCRPDDENSIYNAVLAAYHSPVKEGLREIVTQTTWEKTAMETFKTYQEILGDRAEVSVETPVSPPQVHGGYDMAPSITEVQEILEKGEIAAREKDFETAVPCLHQALAMNPTSVRALVALGAVSLAQNDVPQAIDYFQKGENLDSENAKVQSGKGMCLMMTGEQIDAHACFVKALQEEPEDIVAILQLIEASYAIGQFEELAGVLEKYTASNPDNIDMLYCYAGCLYKLGHVEKSKEVNAKVLEASPGHQGAQELAEAISSPPAADSPDSIMNRQTKILETENAGFEQPVWTSPDDVPGFSIDDRLFELEYMKRDRKTAEVTVGANEIIDNPRATDAQKEQASMLLAEVAVLEGNLEAAHGMYQSILGKNPLSARAITGMGAIMANTGRWEEARDSFQRAAEIDPNYDVPFAGLGLYHTWKQELDVAWDLYQQALKRNPENQRAVLGAIEVGFAMSKFGEVEEIIRTWLEHKPGDLDLIYSLAGCLYSQGRTEEACSELEKVFIFNPDHKTARELYEQIKQGGSATNPNS